jgi:inner membrane protein
MAFGAAIALLFAVLYVLLLQEQTALVIGSMMLFAVIAGVMIVTRRINWYGVLDQTERPAG